MKRSSSLRILTFTLFASCLMLWAPAPQEISAQTESLRSRAVLHWMEETIRIETLVPLAGRSGVPTTLEAQRSAERTLSRRALAAVYNVQLDSLSTVGERLEEAPELASRLLQSLGEPRLSQRHPTPDLASVMLEHRVDLYPNVVEPFVQHRETREPPAHIGWIPTRDFTGIVIYAAEMLPLYGTDRREYVVPSLLPEIYDTSPEMRTIVSADMVDPTVLRTRGVAAYANSPDERPYQERIGLRPLRIRATGTFGVYPTDIIIHEEDANTILASEHNRRLIEEGRILIILNDSVTTTSLRQTDTQP